MNTGYEHHPENGAHCHWAVTTTDEGARVVRAYRTKTEAELRIVALKLK